MSDKKLIWVVDDYEFVRTAVIKTLGKDKYNIREFDSADEAIQELDTISSVGGVKPDLIITDRFTDSRFDGFDVIKKATGIDIKSIMYTAEDKYAARAIEIGASDCFVKGLTHKKDFLACIEKLLADKIEHLPHTQTAEPTNQTVTQLGIKQ